MSWEPHQGIAPNVQKTILCRTLYGHFTSLTLQACAYASRSAALYRAPARSIREIVFTWVDEWLDLKDKNLARCKEHLLQAFDELAGNQAKFPFTEKKPTYCPVCDSMLVTAYTEPLVCERCMQPVLDALDDLVRATTTEWTPEELRESYLNALRSVPETE